MGLIYENHTAASDSVDFLCVDCWNDQRVPAVSADHDYDRRRPQRRDAGYGGADLQLRLPVLSHGLCFGILLDFVRNYYGVYGHSNEGSGKVGTL